MGKRIGQSAQRWGTSLEPPHLNPLPQGERKLCESPLRLTGRFEGERGYIDSLNSFTMLILIISLCFFTCAGSGRRVAEPDLAHRIVGEWEWVESFGGFAGEHRTPESVGYTKKYVFRPDHTFLQYRDDTLVVRRKYRITEKVVWKKERAKVLEIEGMTDQIIGFEGNDTLKLTGHCYDCFSEVFIRIGRE